MLTWLSYISEGSYSKSMPMLTNENPSRDSSLTASFTLRVGSHGAPSLMTKKRHFSRVLARTLAAASRMALESMLLQSASMLPRA